MIIGRFQPHYSFATLTSRFSGNKPTIQSNCMNIGKGKYEWNGDKGSGTGHSCAQARQDFCNRYGPVKCKGYNLCYGEKCLERGEAKQVGGNLGGLIGDDPLTDQLQKTLGLDKKNTGGGASVGDSEHCQGCTNTGDVIGYTGCLIGKGVCEIQGAITDGMGEFGKYLPVIALGIGGILLITIIKR